MQNLAWIGCAVSDTNSNMGSAVVDLLMTERYDEAYFHLLYYFGVCELCFSTVKKPMPF